MGRYFTVLADYKKSLIKVKSKLLRYIFYIFYPFLDLLVKVDDFKFIQDHPRLGKFHRDYFIISKR